MEFDAFLQYIPKIVKQPLPGVNAHLKMAPLERVASLDSAFYKNSNPRQSAVMILIYPKNNKACLVLTRRNTYAGVHSSQISFPGGRKEVFDADMQATALRETFEEIGILPQQVEIIRPFSEIYIPPSNFIVYPFLGVAREQLKFSPSEYEVNAVIELPLEVFLDEAIVVKTEMETSYSHKTRVPAFLFDGHIVWGATAMMLSEFKEVLKSIVK